MNQLETNYILLKNKFEDPQMKTLLDLLCFHLTSDNDSNDIGKNIDDFNCSQFKEKVYKENEIESEKVDELISVLKNNRKIFDDVLNFFKFGITRYYYKFGFCLYDHVNQKLLHIGNNEDKLKVVRDDFVQGKINENDLSINKENIKNLKILKLVNFDYEHSFEFVIYSPYELEEVCLNILHNAKNSSTFIFNTSNKNKDDIESYIKQLEDSKDNNNFPHYILNPINNEIKSKRNELKQLRKNEQAEKMYNKIIKSKRNNPSTRRMAVDFIMNYAQYYSSHIDFIELFDEYYCYGDNIKEKHIL